MNTVFDVIEVGADGRTLEPVGGVTASELRLHSRDLSIFASDSRLSPQRATIAARGDRVLFRTEAIKAVIEKDKCTLIKTKRDRDFHDIIKPMTLVVRAQPEVPFELSVLEVLLHVTLLYFERRRAHIHWVVDRIVGDAAATAGGAGPRPGRSGAEGPLGSGDPFGGIRESTVQQFVPVGKLLTAVLHDAKETCDAINRFLDDDREALGCLLLSMPPPPPPEQPTHGSLHLAPSDLTALGAAPLAGSADYLVDADRSVAAATAAAKAAAAAARRGEAGPGLDGTGDGGGSSGGGGEGAGMGELGLRRGSGVVLPVIGTATPAERLARMRSQALEDASRILETYLREMESIVGSLLESEDYLESMRETYRMQLDSARNHIILVNLWISVASISLMLASLPATLFGMNVHTGLEDSVLAFVGITGFSCAVGYWSYPYVMRHFTTRFERQNREGAWNLRMLRTFLMQHSDDLEAIREALRSLPRGGASSGLSGFSSSGAPFKLSLEDFRRHMRSRLPRSVRLSDSQLEYLFAHIDLDKDGVLSEVEATLQSTRDYPRAAIGDNGNGDGDDGDGGSSRSLSHALPERGLAAVPAVAAVASDGLLFEGLLFEEAVMLGELDEPADDGTDTDEEDGPGDKGEAGKENDGKGGEDGTEEREKKRKEEALREAEGRVRDEDGTGADEEAGGKGAGAERALGRR